MADFSQYPDYAMMDDPDGGRRKKPWVSGPSPLAMALMTGGLGILATPDRVNWGESGGGGGFDPSYIAQGGLLGLQAFGQEHQNLRNQRLNFFNQRRAEENQKITNIKAKQEWDDREEKRKQFPLLMKELKALNNPTITARLPSLMRMPVDQAYATAANLLSTATGKRWGAPELIDGSYFQKTIDGTEYKYLHTPSKTSDISKLSAPEIMGQLVDSSTKLQEWNYKGRGVLSSKPGISPKLYDSLYRLKMKMDTRELKLKDRHGDETVKLIKEKLGSVIEPEAYAIMAGFTPKQIEAYQINKPLIDIKEFTSEAKRTITEAKDIGKVGLIAQVENGLEQQTTRYDPTKVSAQSYANYLTDGIAPFGGEARSYEQMALTGSRMFGYLFSGATVKDDENRAMRIALYPFPGDSLDDVERKRGFRKTIIDLYKTYIPPSIGDKLFKTIINNAENNQVTTSQEVKKIVASDNSTSQPIPELNSAESINTLDNIWEESRN